MKRGRPKGSKSKAIDIDLAIEMYERGCTLLVIGIALGAHQRTVRDRLCAAGVKFRTRSEQALMAISLRRGSEGRVLTKTSSNASNVLLYDQEFVTDWVAAFPVQQRRAVAH